MLRLSNPKLAVLQPYMIAPGLLERAADLAHIVARVEDVGWEKVYAEDTLLLSTLTTWLYEQGTLHAPGVFSIPLLSPDFADDLDAQFYEWREHAAPNTEEAKPYQIPEITLRDNCPPLYLTLESIHSFFIKAISMIVYGWTADYIQSIQLARYAENETGKGNWHIDNDSDLTVTIPLRGVECFDGGGVELQLDAAQILQIPPLKMGHALFFRGKTTLHRGIPVTWGVRQLLVYWTTKKYRG